MLNKKIILGYRNKTEIKKGAISTMAIILLVGALCFSSLFLLVKGKLTDKLIGVAVVFALFALMFIFYLKHINKQKKINSYPDEAVYFEDGYICIAEEDIIKIDVLKIKEVKANNLLEYNQHSMGISQTTKNEGAIIITTNDNKKYKVESIKDVQNVRIEIEDIRTKVLVEAYNEEKIKEFEEKIEKAKTDDNIKKIEVNNLLFVYDDKFKHYETITTINDIKVEISFNESIEEDQKQSIKTIKSILKDFAKFYKKVLANLADDLIENANDWNNDDHEITKEEFINRIDKKYIQISVTEEDYEIFFEDDDIFHGHTIVYNGSVNSEEFYTDIAG